MQLNSESYRLLYPSQMDWDKFCQYRPDVPFSDEVIDYLNALSSSLMKDKECRLYPDVVTFAFFCRKGNLLKLREEYCRGQGQELRLGRGILFHIAPSNVPVNFAYSMVAGLLAGNYNIVRASSKDFSQVSLIVKHLQKLSDFNEVSKRIAVVRYGHDSEANAVFSSIANVRVIWGGDQTIVSVRQYPLPPRSFDVCFADRYSIAAINPDAIMAAMDDEMERLAQAFYNDTYLFDQNACSAPHLVFWLKSVDVDKAKHRFWNALHLLVDKKYGYREVMSVDKLTAFYKQAVQMRCHWVQTVDNKLIRVQIDELPKDIDSFRCAGGYFSEYDMGSLDDIALIVNPKYQTLAYYGFEKSELQDFVFRNRLTGLDRIVPIGETTSFALKWDGYDLINTFSRLAVIL